MSLSLSPCSFKHTKEKKKDELKKKKGKKSKCVLLKKKKKGTNKQEKKRVHIGAFMSLFLMIICCTLDHVSKFLHGIFLSPLSRRLNKKKTTKEYYFIIDIIIIHTALYFSLSVLYVRAISGTNGS